MMYEKLLQVQSDWRVLDFDKISLLCETEEAKTKDVKHVLLPWPFLNYFIYSSYRQMDYIFQVITIGTSWKVKLAETFQNK